MSKPKRIQRRRTKGWRLPDNAVSITRPGKFGNPYKTAYEFRQVLGMIRDGQFAGVDFENPTIARMKRIADSVEELRSKNLACFCPEGQPCHGDVLIELANAEPTQ